MSDAALDVSDADLTPEHRKVLSRLRQSMPTLIADSIRPLEARVGDLEKREALTEASVAALTSEVRSGFLNMGTQLLGLGIQIGKATGVSPDSSDQEPVEDWSGAPIGEKGIVPWLAFLVIRQPKVMALVFGMMALLVALLGGEKILDLMRYWHLLPAN